jgi:hypothetical protein
VAAVANSRGLAGADDVHATATAAISATQSAEGDAGRAASRHGAAMSILGPGRSIEVMIELGIVSAPRQVDLS